LSKSVGMEFYDMVKISTWQVSIFSDQVDKFQTRSGKLISDDPPSSFFKLNRIIVHRQIRPHTKKHPGQKFGSGMEFDMKNP